MSMKQFFLFLLVGLVLVLIQTISWNRIFPCVVTLNISFAFVIFLALYHPSASSCFIVFLLGYTLDTLSGVPAGLFSLINLASFFLIRVSSRVMLFESMVSQAFLVFALSFLANFFLLIITKIAFSNSLGSTLTTVLANSFLLMILCMPLFVFYNRKHMISQ